MPDGNFPAPVRIKVRTPYTDDQATLDARMARNDARNLPEAVEPKTCIIIGSGPSSRSEALWARLKANPDLTIVACNGALQVCLDHGHAPTYWSCCDPQEGEVLKFVDLPYLPTSTIYLVATKCPDRLFDALSHREVRRWRLDDMQATPGAIHIPCAVSITLVTMNLMRFLGFHRFETYGWDCCYLDGKHHASDQPEPTQLMTFSMEAGDRLHAELTEHGPIYSYEEPRTVEQFQICGSWFAELDDACIQAHNFLAMGYEIVVHGPGAVGALLRAKGLIA